MFWASEGGLYLGKKQQLKQVENCSVIPWSSYDTHHTFKPVMIREVLTVLSLFTNFFNDQATFGPFTIKFENTNECSCIFRVWIQLHISIHYQSNFVKNSKLHKKGSCLFARFSGPISYNELIKGVKLISKLCLNS